MATSAGPKQGHDDPYIRRIVSDGDRTLIESCCRHCGVLIVGSVTETLVADELAHLRQCPNHHELSR